jgi:hypothetical protein
MLQGLVDNRAVTELEDRQTHRMLARKSFCFSWSASTLQGVYQQNRHRHCCVYRAACRPSLVLLTWFHREPSQRSRIQPCEHPFANTYHHLGLPRREAVDVTVVHAESCCDQYGIVNVQISSAVSAGFLDECGGDPFTIALHLFRNGEKSFQLWGDRRSCVTADDAFDKCRISMVEMGGGCGVAGLAEVAGTAR